jgi:hypothetical protein
VTFGWKACATTMVRGIKEDPLQRSKKPSFEFASIDSHHRDAATKKFSPSRNISSQLFVEF